MGPISVLPGFVVFHPDLPECHHNVRRPAPNEHDDDGNGEPECPLPGPFDVRQVVTTKSHPSGVARVARLCENVGCSSNYGRMLKN